MGLWDYEIVVLPQALRASSLESEGAILGLLRYEADSNPIISSSHHHRINHINNLNKGGRPVGTPPLLMCA